MCKLSFFISNEEIFNAISSKDSRKFELEAAWFSFKELFAKVYFNIITHVTTEKLIASVPVELYIERKMGQATSSHHDFWHILCDK